MRARDIVVLDVAEVLGLTDYFVIATGTSVRQLQAVADEIVRVLKKQGVQRLFMSGEREGGWILIDFGEIVVHLFSRDAREHYGLEALWHEAVALDWANAQTAMDLSSLRQRDEAPPFGIS